MEGEIGKKITYTGLQYFWQIDVGHLWGKIIEWLKIKQGGEQIFELITLICCPDDVSNENLNILSKL